MELKFVDLAGVTKAVLDGRLDTASVNVIETRFIASIVPKAQSAIVDLSAVTFVASLGIRMLVGTARALAGKGAKLALFGANDTVLDILETNALSDVMPILATEDEALAAVAG